MKKIPNTQKTRYPVICNNLVEFYTTIFEWKFWSDAWSNLDGIWICLRCHECLSICLRRTHFDRKWQCGGTGSEAYFCNFERFFSSNWILQQSLRAYHEKTDEARLMNFSHHIDSILSRWLKFLIILLCIAKFYNDSGRYNSGHFRFRRRQWI